MREDLHDDEHDGIKRALQPPCVTATSPNSCLFLQKSGGPYILSTPGSLVIFRSCVDFSDDGDAIFNRKIVKWAEFLGDLCAELKSEIVVSIGWLGARGSVECVQHALG
jgi:hypothetical protein